MTIAKNDVFIGLQLENCYLEGAMSLWWVELLGGTFADKRQISKVLASGGGTPSILPVDKPCCPLANM